MAVATTQTREYYKVLLVSASGKGKTFSFRDVDPATFGFINIENKPLPFKNQFKYHSKPESRVDAYNKIVEYAKNPEVTAIGIDSFSAYTDMVMAEARLNYKGYDIFNFYNEQIAKFFDLIKRIKKEVVLTAHYEILGMEGAMEKRVKVKGKEWEGVVEKEFTIVLYGDNKFKEDGQPEYFFRTVEEGTSAKCPPDIFKGKMKIDNNVKMILDSIHEFVK